MSDIKPRVIFSGATIISTPSLQSVAFCRYSFGKSGILLRLLRHNMILIPLILMEVRRRAIIVKRFAAAFVQNLKSAINAIKTKRIFTFRPNKHNPQIDYAKMAE